MNFSLVYKVLVAALSPFLKPFKNPAGVSQTIEGRRVESLVICRQQRREKRGGSSWENAAASILAVFFFTPVCFAAFPSSYCCWSVWHRGRQCGPRLVLTHSNGCSDFYFTVKWGFVCLVFLHIIMFVCQTVRCCPSYY